MFEIHVGELRATFLRNHNMRRHKDPTRKTTQAQQTEDPQARNTTQAEDNSSTEDPRNPDSRHNRHKHGGTAPVTWRCTRYVAVHPNRRGALPTDRVQRPNKQEQMRNWHTEPLTATPLHAHLGPTGGRMGTPPTPPPALRPTPAHSGPLRHLLHPYMRRARSPSPSHAEKGVGPGVSSGAHPQSVRIRPASRRRCARGTWPAAR